eukprot:XP_011444740.1 PREDICTED: uncharacterized protein LOC105340412 [Crassostrea gigas]
MNASRFNAISKLFSEYVVTRQCMKCAPRRYSSFSVGDKAALSKTFTKDDVETFAKISMDNNPLHTDPDFAKTTIFGKCIVHGVLINGLISAVCSTKLPGPGAVYISQEMKFLAPAFVDESITAEVEVLEIRKSIMKCSTTAIRTGNKEVLVKGEAKLLIPKVT